MSQVMSADTLLRSLERWQIDSVPVRRGGISWQQHSRPPSTGDFGDMHGVLNHHTGPFSTVRGMVALLWDGRSDLPGPLCHVATAPDGRLFLIGWNGRSNHAGLGGRNVAEALLREDDPPPPGPDVVDGNAVLYGNEVMHPGDESPYPVAQIETAVRFNAAICEHHGWTSNSAIMHREWTTRKRDMSWREPRSGNRFRAEIDRALRLGPSAYRFEQPVAAQH